MAKKKAKKQPKKEEHPVVQAIRTTFLVYVLLLIIQFLVTENPLFAKTGWFLFGSVVAGVGYYFKKKLFK